MKVNLIAYGIAKDILNGGQTKIELSTEPSIGAIKQELVKKFPDFQKLQSLKFAVNEDYQDDEYVVSEQDEVVIIPPVSGG